MRLLGPTGMSTACGKIAVVVADEKYVAAVLVVVPALVRAGDAATELPAGFTGQLYLSGEQRSACEHRCHT